MTARGFALPAAVVAVLVVVVDASPGSLSCVRSITSGTIMGEAVNRLTSTQVQLAKDGNTIACGGTLTAGDTGLTLVKASSGVGSQYKIEAIASAGTGAWGIISGDCSMQRLDNTVDNTYTVPPSGTVTLRIAHANSNGAVSTSADCTYTVQAGGSGSAASPPPTSPPPSDTDTGSENTGQETGTKTGSETTGKTTGSETMGTGTGGSVSPSPPSSETASAGAGAREMPGSWLALVFAALLALAASAGGWLV